MTENVLKHRGYLGSVEVSLDDSCLHGRILYIDDVITYEGQDVAALREAFIACVDRYLADYAESGKSPNKPFCGGHCRRTKDEPERTGHESH